MRRMIDVDRQMHAVGVEARDQRRGVDREATAVARLDRADFRKHRDPLRRRGVGVGGQCGREGVMGESGLAHVRRRLRRRRLRRARDSCQRGEIPPARRSRAGHGI